MSDYPVSDHCDGTRFFNPAGRNGVAFSQIIKYFREPKTKWPKHVHVDQVQPPARAGDEVVITMIGHSTFLIQTPLGNIITDPVFSSRVGPFGILGPKRVRAPGIRIEDLPKIDLILLSHNHYDHCDFASLRKIIARDAPQCITALGDAVLLRKLGAKNPVELDWWQGSDAWRARVTAMPAQHFASRTPFDRNRTLWCGFLIEQPGCVIYFAGDSGYGAHFKEIGARVPQIDVALMPIGAYLPRWFMADIHVDPDEAVRAHVDVKSRQSIAMHWGTFQLTAEGIDDPVTALRESQRRQNVDEGEFAVLLPGESWRASRKL